MGLCLGWVLTATVGLVLGFNGARGGSDEWFGFCGGFGFGFQRRRSAVGFGFDGGGFGFVVGFGLNGGRFRLKWWWVWVCNGFRL